MPAMPRSDMFLRATGQRSGEIAGESNDRRFGGQIEIAEWRWGMSSPSAVSGQRAGRMQIKELVLVKRVDRASPALMSVMRTNELLSSAVLSVRKAGGTDPLPYFVVTLERARIVAFDIESGFDADGAPSLIERLSLSFQQLTAAYVPQAGSGSGGGESEVVIDNSPV
jgi:type VI secretion system secreted protein Hcp